ncbi:Vgb family protein [Roseimaritima sediminicola]|uniref:Vgb family protein n=1 Tax=Roseimaritima sediminicola TaxID=2662066 RepID=UPI00129841F6|nr:hypothetical protein [Roseimaritima sediminicola]
MAQPTAAQAPEEQLSRAQAAKEQADKEPAPAVAYPLNLDVGPGGAVTVVDLDLPGLWRLSDAGQTPELFFRGPVKMRTPMNRPRCVLALEGGDVLVGDSASRDIYRIAADTDPAQLKGLTDGFIGIPMCLALSPDGQTLYVGDAERRALFRVDLEGGQPELVAPVNARGLSFDAGGRLWALTPDDAAIVTIDAEGEVTPLVTGRPFQYPGGLVHVADAAYVTDGYGKAIWRVDGEGQVGKWFEGGPLKHPVGIAAGDGALLVADPHNKQIFRFPLTEKPTAEPLLP